MREVQGASLSSRKVDVVRAPQRVPGNAAGVCVYSQFSISGKFDTRAASHNRLYRFTQPTLTNMAAVMNTPSHARFDASFGAGGLRGPYLTPDPPSMVDQLPSIKFGFDDLRDRMARFTQRFDLFIDQGRKRVLEERNHFRINMSEIQGQSSPATPNCSAC